MDIKIINKFFAKYSSGTLVSYHYKDKTIVVYDSLIRTLWLNSEGARSITLKNRINSAIEDLGLEFQLYQAHYAWYIKGPDGSIYQYRDRLILHT